MKTLINWKVFWLLLIASVISVVLILPYSMELQSPAVDLTQLPIPLPVLLALQTVQNGIFFAILIFVGLLLAGRVGLGAPILESAMRGESVAERVRAILPVSIFLGLIAGVLIIALEIFYFQTAMMNELGDTATALNLQTAQPAAWKGFLASFYGGIAEEVLLRLFMMTLLVWLGSFIRKTAEGKPTSTILWMANILAALLFGIGHLPTVAMLVPLTPLVITRTILLNGVGGIIFGWLYWKRGLESAMIAHFSADIVLHALLAL